MKKVLSVLLITMFATSAFADALDKTKVAAAASYVDSAFNALDSAKQDVLTTAQQNAVDSGITAGKVSTYDGYATTIAGKQDTIDSTHKLSADLVDDSTTTNKFVTASEKSQITTNQNAITTLNANDQTVGSVDYKIAQATSGMVTASSTTTFTNKTIDATGTGNSITNLGTSNFASGTVVDSTTGIAAAATASDSKLVTEKAVRSAVDTATTGMVTTSGTQTLTNKTIDADNNTISNLEADNFKTGVVRTSTDTIRATASATDTSLVTEKAVRNAIDTAATVTVTGSTQYGAVTDVSNANGGIQVTKGDAKLQIKSSGTVTGSATMWIE